MLKGKSLQRFLINFKWAVIIAVFLLLGITAAINLHLPTLQSKITSSINQELNYAISIGNMFYQFPNQFYIYDISVKSHSRESFNSSLDLAKARVKLSLPDLFFQKKILISDIKLYESRINYHDVMAFCEGNMELLKNIFKNMPPGNAKIRFSNLHVNFLDNKELILDSVFKVFNDTIMGMGRVQKVFYMRENISGRSKRAFWDVRNYYFRFNALITDKKILLDSIDIQNMTFQAKLWGSWDAISLKIKGYALVDTLAQNDEEKEPMIRDWLTSLVSHWREGGHFYPNGKDFTPNLHILDIDSTVSFAFPQVNLKNLSFGFNGTPVRLHGFFDLSDKAKASITGEMLPSRQMVFFEKAKFQLNANRFKGQDTVGGKCNIYFDKGASEYSLKEIDINFSGLMFDLEKIIPLDFYLDKITIRCKTRRDKHHLTLNDVRGRINHLNKELKIIDLFCPLHGGTLGTQVWISTKDWPAEVSANMNIRDVNLQQLHAFIPEFAKFRGKLNGRITFSSKNRMELFGVLKMNDGKLVNLDFFQWLSESFDMPSLTTIDFDAVTTEFKVNAEALKFQEIDLDSEDVTIYGNYRVDSQNLVSSILELSFSKEILKESPKFRPILKMFSSDLSHLPFKFQLSGNQDSVNFYWMDSFTKRKIQDKIPNFIERRIEKGINRMVTEPKSP